MTSKKRQGGFKPLANPLTPRPCMGVRAMFKDDGSVCSDRGGRTVSRAHPAGSAAAGQAGGPGRDVARPHAAPQHQDHEVCRPPRHHHPRQHRPQAGLHVHLDSPQPRRRGRLLRVRSLHQLSIKRLGVCLWWYSQTSFIRTSWYPLCV